MIIVNIIGGLGNQMFQYAFGYAVSKKNNQPFKLDINDFKQYNLRDYGLGLFSINVKLVSQNFNIIRLWSKLFPKQFYLEKNSQFDKNVYQIQGDIFFKGYWQSEKYFKEYRNELLEQFTLKNDIHSKTKTYQQQINNANAVSLHIRRGDYITNQTTNSHHGVCSLDFYKNAVLEISKQSENPHFFIFSDDLDWAKHNLDFINHKTFVELDKHTPDHEEMYLMSLCKHNIIANSSFSWWGAWLNQNDNKQVIAPKKWFNDTTKDTSDLIPSSWVRL